jgi:hypothetical protein
MSKSPASRTRPSRRSKSPAAAPKRRRTAVAAAGERLGSFEKLLDDGQWDARGQQLSKGLAVAASGDGDKGARVFVAIRSSTLVLGGMALALATILGTIAASCYFPGGSWQRTGLLYPYISETARDMPQAGAFSSGMTVTSMVMVGCAILQFGKVKRDLAATATTVAATTAATQPAGTRRNLTSLITGIVAPPFLGLLACYDTRRAPNAHRACVVVFFVGTMVYMFTTLSLYEHLASQCSGGSGGGGGGGGGAAAAAAVTASQSAASAALERRRAVEREPNVRFSLRIKRVIAAAFVVFTLLYLPIGAYMCKQPLAIVEGYNEPGDIPIHAARAACQHCAVICIILYYGTFYYDFGDLKLYLVNA